MENTKIAWATHTFNPWIGCSKVSQGCKFCYAEELMDKRYHKVNWGPGNPRTLTSEGNWALPYRWNRQAQQQGIRPRVFCASLADIFDEEVPPDWRKRLWGVVHDCNHLDWLMLSKRPQHFRAMLPAGPGTEGGGGTFGTPWPWSWVWLGVTCEDASQVDRLRILRSTPAALRFASLEPLLECFLPQDHLFLCQRCLGSMGWIPTAEQKPLPIADALLANLMGDCPDCLGTGWGIAWWILGGESGHQARPCHLEWIETIAAHVSANGGLPFVKQLGSHPLRAGTPFKVPPGTKGDDPASWPESLRIRQVPASCVPANQQGTLLSLLEDGP